MQKGRERGFVLDNKKKNLEAVAVCPVLLFCFG